MEIYKTYYNPNMARIVSELFLEYKHLFDIESNRGLIWIGINIAQREWIESEIYRATLEGKTSITFSERLSKFENTFNTVSKENYLVAIDVAVAFMNKLGYKVFRGEVYDKNYKVLTPQRSFILNKIRGLEPLEKTETLKIVDVTISWG